MAKLDTVDSRIAAFTLVFMSVQFLFIEGWAVSIPKVVFMAISPFILILRSPVASKATLWGALFFFVTVGMMIVQFEDVRMSTFYYTALFLLVFNLYYNLVHVNGAFTIDSFLSVVKFVIMAYFYVLLAQQVLFLIGVNYFPLVNLMGLEYYSEFKFNTLAIEPSHAARILVVYFYAYLKLLEYRDGTFPRMRDLWQEHRGVVFAFLYTMLLMGSGTAMVGLALLSLCFLRKEYAIYMICAAFLFYMIIPMIDYEPLNRAVAVFNVALTGDTEEMRETDSSAATRVNIIIDTIKYLDLSDADTWFGKGTDGWMTSKHAVVSAIVDYGLISYITKIFFFCACCFTSIFSFELLVFVLLLSFNVGNIAYGWAILMVFSTLKYLRVNG